MEVLRPIVGIDYGGRYTGTTALAACTLDQIFLTSCPKRTDADTWIGERLDDLQPRIIAIDAPLSLPSGVLDGKGDFHLRIADRLCGAMSPMFLGGLTARAMALHTFWKGQALWVETYPSWMARARLGCKRTDHDEVVNMIRTYWTGQPIPKLTDQHQVDALLALMAAEHVRTNTSWHYGDPREGVIVI